VSWQIHGLLSVVACIGWAGGCLLAGLVMLRFFCGVKVTSRYGAAATLGSGMALGVGVIGVVWHFIAFLGLMSITPVAGVLTAAVLLGGFVSAPILSDTMVRLHVGVRRSLRLPRLWLPVLVLLVVLVAYLGLATVSPPGTDAMAVYMTQAKLIAATGRLVPVRDYESFFQFGLTAELNYAALIILEGEIAAKMSVFFVALASAAILWAITARVGLGLIGRWAALVMLFTSTAFTLVLWDGKTDLYANLFGLATIYWALRLGERPLWMASLMVGVMAGLAVTNKPSLLVVLPPMILILATWRFGALGRAREMTPSWPVALIGAILLIGVGALLAAAPVVVKNFVLLNEPLAPFLYIHGGSGVDFTQTWYTPENTRWIVLTYPFALTLGKYPMQHGTLSALTLAFLPLMLMRNIAARRAPAPLRFLTIAALVAVLAWIVTCPSILAPRYILPAILALIPIAAFAVDRLWDLHDWQPIKIGAVTLCAGFLVIGINSLNNTVWDHLTYLKYGPAAYKDPIWRAAAVVNASPPGTRIFLAMYYRSMIRPDLLQCMVELAEFESGAKYNSRLETKYSFSWSQLYASGAHYVVLDRLTHSFLKIDEKAPPDWLHVTKQKVDEQFSVYRLDAENGPPRADMTCREVRPGFWQPPPH
jgi:hypothetical protein